MSSGDSARLILRPNSATRAPYFSRLMNELETVAGRACSAAQHADHEAGVERRQLLQRSRPVVGDLEEFRPLRLGEAGEAPDDRVVDELRHGLRRQAALDVRIEHLEEIREAVGFGVVTKILERLEGGMVGVDVIGERDGIKPKVGQRLHMLERCGAERPRRLVMKRRSAMAPDVGRVIGADDRLDACSGENLRLTRLSRFETEVSMMSTTSCLTIASIESRNSARVAKSRRRSVGGQRRPNRMQARPHVGVLSIGDDEIRTPIGAAARCARACRRVLNMKASPVWPPVYRPPSTDGNRLEQARWRSPTVVASLRPPAGPAIAGGVSMSKSLLNRRNARTVRGWLLCGRQYFCLLLRAQPRLRAPRTTTLMRGPKPGSAGRAGPTSAPRPWSQRSSKATARAQPGF